MSESRRSMWGWLRLLAGMALVGVLATRVDLARLSIRSWRDVAVGGSVAVGLLLLAQWVSALRWRAVLGGGAPPLTYLFRLYLVGQFFGLFLPTSVGGDAVRAVALSRASGDGVRAVTSILADRLIGVAALGAYLAAGLALAGADRGMILPLDGAPRWRAVLAMALLGSLVLVALGWRLLATRPAWRRRLDQVRGLLPSAPLDWAWLALLSLAVQGCYLLTWWAIAVALRLPIPPDFLLVAVPAVSLAAMVPFTLSGLGVREGAWIALLAPLDITAADALAYSLVYFAAFTVVGGMGGCWFALRGTGPVHDEGATTVGAPAPATRGPS